MLSEVPNNRKARIDGLLWLADDIVADLFEIIDDRYDGYIYDRFKELNDILSRIREENEMW